MMAFSTSLDDVDNFPPLTAPTFSQRSGRRLRGKTTESDASTVCLIRPEDAKAKATEDLTELPYLGFPNLGNTCYLASSLQLMFATPSLVRQIREHSSTTCSLALEQCHWCLLR